MHELPNLDKQEYNETQTTAYILKLWCSSQTRLNSDEFLDMLIFDFGEKHHQGTSI